MIRFLILVVGFLVGFEACYFLFNEGFIKPKQWKRISKRTIKYERIVK